MGTDISVSQKNKDLRTLVAVGLLGVTLLYAGLNQLLWDKRDTSYDEEGKVVVVSRARGPFGFISLLAGFEKEENQKPHKYEVRYSNGLSSSKFIVDGWSNGGVQKPCDGLVDLIITEGFFGEEHNQITRETDFEKYKKQFEAADKLLAETKARLKITTNQY